MRHALILTRNLFSSQSAMPIRLTCPIVLLSSAFLALPSALLAAENVDDAVNPLRFYHSANGSFLQATLGLDLAFFSQGNAWYGNDKGILKGQTVDSWWESLIRIGLEGNYVLPNTQSLYAKINVVQANTFGGIDADGTNAGMGDVKWLGIDNAYVGWRSGTLFNSLGQDFLDLSFGRQIYTVGTGFLFASEGEAGFQRAAYYLGGRNSADYAAIARMKSGAWSGDLFYFKDNSILPSNTRAGGCSMEYAFTDIAILGGSFSAIESDLSDRDGMQVFNLRGSINPFALINGPMILRPLTLEGEFVREQRDNNLPSGFGWYAAVSYQWSEMPWKPKLTYRYASFDEHYDTLFYSSTDWGSWFQGEITGEYDLFNTNLDSHMLRLKVQPVEPLTLNLFYYRFSLHNPGFFGVQDSHYADEWDLTADWTVNRHLTVSLVGALAVPGSGAIARLGGDSNWTATMVMITVRY
ncbi:MAG: alginate export family protein [Desulfobulbus sp.]|nr:alginate export family protein [Desulfobulbus sp.]